MGETWRVCHDAELVAGLEVTEADFPWLYARLRAAPGFDGTAVR